MNSQLVQILIWRSSTCGHDADWNGILLALMSSFLQGFTNWCDLCEYTIHFLLSQKIKMESTWDISCTCGMICCPSEPEISIHAFSSFFSVRNARHCSPLVNMLTLLTTRRSCAMVLRQSPLLFSSMLLSNQMRKTFCTMRAFAYAMIIRICRQSETALSPLMTTPIYSL
jgi:hypothetical protein